MMLFFLKILESSSRFLALVPDGLVGEFKSINLFLEFDCFNISFISSAVTCQLFSTLVNSGLS